jgi:hypothetical protein
MFQVSSIRKASCLHACHYFMSRLVTFSDETADEIHQIVSPYGPPRERYYSSRLLSRQLKYTMHKLHREIMKEVLEGLEKSLRTRTKDSWGPSFCTILVLCLCIENLQTAADTFIVCDVQKSEDEGTTSQYRREHSIAACQDLDSYPFQQSTRLFHDIYRSHRSNREAGGAKDGFNPLRLAQNGEATGLDEATNAMITHVLWVIHENCKRILFR